MAVICLRILVQHRGRYVYWSYRGQKMYLEKGFACAGTFLGRAMATDAHVI